MAPAPAWVSHLAARRKSPAPTGTIAANTPTIASTRPVERPSWRSTPASENERGILWRTMARSTTGPSPAAATALPRATPSVRVWSEKPTKAVSPRVWGCSAQSSPPAGSWTWTWAVSGTPASAADGSGSISQAWTRTTRSRRKRVAKPSTTA